MTFNEFYELLEASTRASTGRLAPFIVHFKPYKEDENRDALPATHPDIKDSVFSIYTGFLRQNIFKINYPYNGNDPKKIGLDELRELFEEQDWSGFTAYKP